MVLKNTDWVWCALGASLRTRGVSVVLTWPWRQSSLGEGRRGCLREHHFGWLAVVPASCWPHAEHAIVPASPPSDAVMSTAAAARSSGLVAGVVALGAVSSGAFSAAWLANEGGGAPACTWASLLWAAVHAAHLRLAAGRFFCAPEKPASPLSHPHTTQRMAKALVAATAAARCYFAMPRRMFIKRCDAHHRKKNFEQARCALWQNKNQKMPLAAAAIRQAVQRLSRGCSTGVGCAAEAGLIPSAMMIYDLIVDQ
jgi:hypothetical protein